MMEGRNGEGGKNQDPHSKTRVWGTPKKQTLEKANPGKDEAKKNQSQEKPKPRKTKTITPIRSGVSIDSAFRLVGTQAHPTP